MPDPVVSTADSELRAHVERALSAQYELDCEIGRGGMGIVYRARDRRLKRLVAVKLLPPELAFRGDIRTRFLREAETAAQLSHPNIVPIYAVDERDGLVYFVMGYIEGENLATRIGTNGPLPVDETRRILREVADALAYAHARNVVHRDIKPDNILLATDGRAMVTDFGIARAVSDSGDSRLTATGMAIGTPAYMAPEQAAGDRDVDGRTDLYSLGVVGYQMLTGEPPFKAGNTPAMLVKHLSEPPVPVTERRSGIPDDLARVVMTLLEKEPANRFTTAQALAAALDGGDVPEPASARRTSSGATRDAMAPRTSGAYDDPAAAGGMATTARGFAGFDTTSGDDLLAPVTPDEMMRWSAAPVVDFRKKITTYIIVNAVILFFAVFAGKNLLGLSAIWGVFMAFKYAKLWSEGYDWRDVFKQPRDRLFFDVAAETIDDARGLFDTKKRAEMRERARRRRLAGHGEVGGRRADGSTGTLPGSAPAGALPSSTAREHAGRFTAIIDQAARDRGEIVRIMESVPKREREQLSHVVPSADALYRKVEALAVSAADLARNSAPNAGEVIEREIALLESQANPLDYQASEDRVRRLAYLKRQRRAVLDVNARRDQAVAKLESCRTALQNMRLDLVRLRTGAETHERITLLAEQAMSLARDVDGLVYGADEVARLTARGQGGGRPLAGPA